MDVEYEVWRVAQDRDKSDEGRIDWRPTREEAKELKRELDRETDNKHEVVAEPVV